MKNLRRLGATVALTLVLGVSAFAGDPITPPCAPPGTTETPPCASAQVTDDESIVPGSTTSPPASSSDTDYSIAEATVDLLMNVLFLF